MPRFSLSCPSLGVMINASAAVLAFFLAVGPTVQAAQINWDFEVTIDAGALIGQMFDGTLQYDDASLTDVGSESTDLTGFFITFNGNSYGLADADSTPFADFFDGDFLGIVDLALAPDEFSRESGYLFGDIADASFGYAKPTPVGFGEIVFTPATPSVPLPATWTLIGLAGLIGMAFRRRRHR